MMNAMTPDQYKIVQPTMMILYFMWGSLWSLVAWHYGQAARATWRAENGKWAECLKDFFAPFSWAIRDILCRLTRRPGFCGTEIPSRYSNGHTLRFAIFLGSLTPAVFGFFFISMDRTNRSLLDMAVTAIFIATSILAAGGHLFLAYKVRPYAWQILVLAYTLLIFLGLPATVFLAAAT